MAFVRADMIFVVGGVIFVVDFGVFYGFSMVGWLRAVFMR